MKTVYLDSAATNLVDHRVLAVAQDFVDLYTNEDLTSSEIFNIQKRALREAREAVAHFISCDADEVALMQSTSHSLGSLSVSLPLEKDNNILICDLEYQASVVTWQAAMERRGFLLKEVKSHNGTITADDFEAAIDEHTKVILLAAVQEINGYRADVKAIGEMAHRHGLLYIVDGIQEVGSLKVDVKELGMDIYCAGGKKWLGNPFGMGFLYINRPLLQKLKPPYYSYYDIQVPVRFGDYMHYLEDPRRKPFDDYDIVQDASVFETGGHGNFLGAMALAEAVRVLEDVGIENVEKHNRTLNRHLYDALLAMGFQMQSSGEEAHMSSIVVFNFDGLKDNHVEQERALRDFLREQKIFVTVRCSTGLGGVRVSFHHYTTKEDIDAFLDAVRVFLKKGVMKLS